MYAHIANLVGDIAYEYISQENGTVFFDHISS